MLSIIICDDSEIQRKDVERTVLEQIEKMPSSIELALSTSNPKEVLEYVKANVSKTYIYFFDVDLNSTINGLELAKEIRKFDGRSYLIFITAHSQFSLLTYKYKVQATNYILKLPRDEMRAGIIDCINEAVKHYEAETFPEQNKLYIEQGAVVKLFNLGEILFFETVGEHRKLRLHMVNELNEFYGSLRDLEKKVTKDYYRTHKGYLVNTRLIKEVDKEKMEIRMINDEVCYVSLRYLKGLLKIWQK